METTTLHENRVHDLQTLETKLEQVRDELRIKMHLAKADARDSFDGLEMKWQHFRSHLGALREAGGEAAEDVGQGVKALGRELTEGYEKIRKAL
jgi:DNA-binding transcriptional ArsR family regulator